MLEELREKVARLTVFNLIGVTGLTESHRKLYLLK